MLGILHGGSQGSIQPSIHETLPLLQIGPGAGRDDASPAGQRMAHSFKFLRTLAQPLGDEPVQIKTALIKYIMCAFHPLSLRFSIRRRVSHLIRQGSRSRGQ